MIEIRELVKNYGKLEVLKNVELTVERGDIYGLLGKSGAGKSTLLRCINGLENYTSGTVKVNGTEISTLQGKELRQFRKDVGMIFQNFSLLDRKTVFQNIEIPLKCWKYPYNQRKKRVEELVQLVGLEDKLNEYSHNLSGGQKQRVAIARALALNPQIVLCDEATSALDTKTTCSILDLLAQINKRFGITIIVVTHEISVVQRICNKISMLEDGKVMISGNTEEILLDPNLTIENLVGNKKDFLEQKGIHYQLTFSGEEEKSRVLAEMAIKTKVPFSIVWGEFQIYRGVLFRTYVIQMDESYRESIESYLSNRQIKYREV